MNVTLEEYTPLSIIVYGPGTYKIKEQLKEIGGKWILLSKTKRKPHHPRRAWMFPMSQKAEVEALIKGKSTKKKKPPQTAKKTPSQKDIENCIMITSKKLGVPPERTRKIIYEEYSQYRPKEKAKRDLKRPKREYDLTMISKILKTKIIDEEGEYIPGINYLHSFSKDDRTDYGISRKSTIFSGKMKEWRHISYSQHPSIKQGKFKFESGTLTVPYGVTAIVCEGETERSCFLDFPEFKKIICPISLEILICENNKWVESVIIQGKGNLAYIDCRDCKKLTSLDLSQTTIKWLFADGAMLDTLILPRTGIDTIDIRRNSMHVLIIPPGLKQLFCEGNFLERILLKKNKQNAGNQLKPSKQEKMALECVPGGVIRTMRQAGHVRGSRGWKKVTKRELSSYRFQGVISYYDKFPTPQRQKELFQKYNPPSVSVFDRFPDDVIIAIMERMPFKDMVNLCLSSKRLFGICSNRSLQASIVSTRFDLKKPIEYYGYKTYFNMYRSLLHFKYWRKIIGDIQYIFGRYIGPEGARIEKEIQKSEAIVSYPKGTIAIAPYSNIYLEDPESVKILKFDEWTDADILESLLKLDPKFIISHYRNIFIIESKKAEDLLDQHVGRKLIAGEDYNVRFENESHSGPPGTQFIEISWKLLWSKAKPFYIES